MSEENEKDIIPISNQKENLENDSKNVVSPNKIIFARYQNDFGKKLLSLQGHKQSCDVELIVNEERIAVHSIVLSASSQYFENAFVKLNQKEVILENVDKETITMLIDYCYSGVLETTEDKAKEIVKIACGLSISTLVEIFCEVSKTLLTIDNCIAYWKIAKSENIKELEALALDFMENKLVEITALQDFLKLDYSEITDLFSSEMVLPTIVAYNSLKQWIYHNKESRVGFSDDLMKLISLENISIDDLLNDAITVCDLNAKCLTRYFNAAKSRNHSHPELSNDYTLLAIDNETSPNSRNPGLFDKNKEEWISLDDFKFMKNNSALLFVDEKLMVIKNLLENNAVEFHDLKKNQSEKVPPLNHKRKNLATIKFNRNVFAIGGSDVDGKPVSYVEKWNPISKTWSNVAPLIIPCFGSGIGVFNDKIYIVGGCVNYRTYLEVIQVYDPYEDKWIICEPMHNARAFLEVVTVNNNLYAVGGTKLDGDWIEKYDPSVDQWKKIELIHERHYIKISNITTAIEFSGKLVIAVNTNYFFGNKTTEFCALNGYKLDRMPSMHINRSNFKLVKIPWSVAQYLLSKKNE